MPIDYSKWEQLQVSDDEDVAADNPTTKMAAAPVSSGCTDPMFMRDAASLIRKPPPVDDKAGMDALEKQLLKLTDRATALAETGQLRLLSEEDYLARNQHHTKEQQEAGLAALRALRSEAMKLGA